MNTNTGESCDTCSKNELYAMEYVFDGNKLWEGEIKGPLAGYHIFHCFF